LTALEIRKDTDYQNDANVSFDTIIQDERATQAQIISNKTEINTIENRSDLKSAQTIVKAASMPKIVLQTQRHMEEGV